MEEPKEPQIRRVAKLPNEAVENEVIYNIEDNCFYMGINEEGTNNGNNLEKASI